MQENISRQIQQSDAQLDRSTIDESSFRFSFIEKDFQIDVDKYSSIIEQISDRLFQFDH